MGERRRITWAKHALNELRNIHRYIARDSVSQAKRVCRMIRERVNNLALFPEIGAVVSEFGKYRVREVHVFSYRIFYRYNAEEEIIEVVSVFHMARELTPERINTILYTEQ